MTYLSERFKKKTAKQTQDALVYIIKQLEIDEYSLVNLDDLGFALHEVIDYYKDLIKSTVVEKAFMVPVIKSARRDYNFLSKNPMGYANHDAVSPAYLAFAIKNNEFTKRELKKINFCDGLEDFVERFHDDELLVKLRERLYNPQEKPKKASDYLILDERSGCDCIHH
ncbi:MAG: hypothetical protein ACP5N3_05760 [Candidatus Nanoarchaeia archaeon]